MTVALLEFGSGRRVRRIAVVRGRGVVKSPALLHTYSHTPSRPRWTHRVGRVGIRQTPRRAGTRNPEEELPFQQQDIGPRYERRVIATASGTTYSAQSRDCPPDIDPLSGRRAI